MIFSRCKHMWEKLEDKTVPSPMTEHVRLGLWAAADVPAWAYYTTTIIILVCSKCGKLDKTVVYGPGLRGD